MNARTRHLGRRPGGPAHGHRVLHKWRFCPDIPAFGDWLAQGAPSDDRITDGT